VNFHHHTMGGETQSAEKASLQKMNRHESHLPEEAFYICDSCGEEIVIPLDLSAGRDQQYVEDCPVCCRPNVIQLNLADDGSVQLRAEGE